MSDPVPKPLQQYQREMDEYLRTRWEEERVNPGAERDARQWNWESKLQMHQARLDYWKGLAEERLGQIRELAGWLHDARKPRQRLQIALGFAFAFFAGMGMVLLLEWLGR